MEVTRRQGRKYKQLLDELTGKEKEGTGTWTVWRTHFGRGCGHVSRQTT